MEVLDGVHPESAGAGEQEIESQEQQVVTTAVVADEAVEVEKTLYDAEEFLSNYAILREENEHLKQSNQQLEEQLEKARQELEELRIDKDKLEGELVQERQENKEALWKLREDYQKIQEDRLQWKEKYLNIYMKNADGSTDGEVSRNKKRKMNDGDSDMFSNIGFMNDQNQQPALQEHSQEQIKYNVRCEKCNFIFDSEIHLSEHMLRVHPTKQKFKCQLCDKTYSSQPSLSRHSVNYHLKPASFKCDKCDKKFNRKDFLEKHLASHSNDKNFTCKICEKKFKSRCSLSAHVNGLHESKRKYVCDVCGYQTSWKSTHREHIKLHSGEMRYYEKRKMQQNLNSLFLEDVTTETNVKENDATNDSKVNVNNLT